MLRIVTIAFLILLLSNCGAESLVQNALPVHSHSNSERHTNSEINAERLEYSDSGDERTYQMLLTSSSDSCQEGLNAFKSTVHTLVRDRCVKCHDTDHNPADPLGPTFAVADAERSYASLVAYQNFDDIPNSIFSKKGGNMHCLNTYGFDCKTTAADINTAVKAWWDGGENQCPRKGKYFSGQLSVPDNLPDRAHGFVKIRWDLGSIGPLLRNTQFEMEAQMFAQPADDNAGAYRFRKPRLVTPSKTVILKDVKILTNGRYSSLEDAFRPIDQTVSPGTVPSDNSLPTPFPVLSAKAQIVLATGKEDQIMVSFEDLRTTNTPVQCKALDKFQSDVMPLLEFRTCYSCHSGGASAEAGTVPANTLFSMNLTPADLCKSFLQRLSRQSFEKSPAVLYPSLAVNGHPLVIAGMEEATRGFKAWYTAEMAP